MASGPMTQNRRVVISRPGGPEVLEVISEDLRAPRGDEAQVRVLASGVAFGDVLKRRGVVGISPKMPFTPGYDLVGVVETLGPGCTRVKSGDRVAAFVVNGANTEHANVSDKLLVPIPSEVDPVESLCLVLNYVTAEQMLRRVAAVKPGQRILVHGAGGGVGTALLQLGKLEGLEMYGTASKAKCELVRELGAVPIDYKNEDFVERVLALTGDGVDLVLDPIGGSHLGQSRRVLRRGGMLIAYGASVAVDGGTSRLVSSLLRLLFYKLIPDGRSYRLYGIHDQASIQEDLKRLLALLGQKKLRPVIGARLALSEAVKAHQLLETAAVAGKIVLVPT